MSKYTTEVRFICEEAARLSESGGYDDLNSIIAAGRNRIFNFDYPIFDNSYKSVLETKIIKHFYTREIGFETVGLWKLKLDTKMNEIMPYYNKLYNSELLQFNPLYDVDLTTEHTRDTSGENEKTGSSNRDIVETPNVTDTLTHNTTDLQTNNLSELQTNNLTNTTSQTVDTDNTNVRTYDTSDTTDAGSSGSSNENISDRTSKTGSGTDTKWDFYSDTPQGNVYDFPDGAHDNTTDEMTYLTNARKNTDSYSNTETVTGSTSKTGTTSAEMNSTVDKTGTVTDDFDGTVETSGTLTKTGTVTNAKTGTVNNAKTGTETNVKTGTIRTDDDNVYGEEGNFETTESYIQHVTGKTSGVSYSKLIEEFRKTFLNIDMMIIRDLEPLFFGLW